MKKYLLGSRGARAAYEAGIEKGFEKGEAAGYYEGDRGFAIAYAVSILSMIIFAMLAIAYGNSVSRSSEKRVKALQDRLEHVYTGGFISSTK